MKLGSLINTLPRFTKIELVSTMTSQVFYSGDVTTFMREKNVTLKCSLHQKVARIIIKDNGLSVLVNMPSYCNEIGLHFDN